MKLDLSIQDYITTTEHIKIILQSILKMGFHLPAKGRLEHYISADEQGSFLVTNEGESADSRAGDIEIGESKLVPKDSLAGYDEWDLRALWNGPSTKTWIRVENAICTSRRKLGGCSGRAYKELEHQISEKVGTLQPMNLISQFALAKARLASAIMGGLFL